MKEPDYVMKIMSMGGPLTALYSCKVAIHWREDVGIEVVHWFRYACHFDFHFRFHHKVDDHSNLYHGLPSIEDSWNMMSLEIRVFLFVLAITKVNAFLALRYFTSAKGLIEWCPTLLIIHQQLAWQLINNS